MPTNTDTASTSIEIRADAKTLWAMVSDVTRMGEWSPENRGGEWLDGATGPQIGNRFKGSNQRGRAKWSTTCEVTAAEPGRVFEFVVGRADKPVTRWTYRFTPTTRAPASTSVTESFELVKPIGFFSRLVTRLTTGVRDRRADLVTGMETTLRNLKVAAERAVQPSGSR